MPEDNSLFLKNTIEQDVLVWAKDGIYIADFPFDAGAWLMDFKKVLLRPQVLRAYVDLFWEKMEHSYPFQVGGLELTALPLVGAIVADSTARSPQKPVNGFFIRKERKREGLQKTIEGALMPNIPIIIVDDILNRGRSAELQVELLEKEGRAVSKIFTILRFRDLSYYKPLTSRGIEIISLFDLNDFSRSTSLKNIQIGAENAIPRPFIVDWYFKSEGARHQFMMPKSGPTIDESALYMGSDSGIFWAIDQKNGKPLWQHKVLFGAGEKMIFSTPCVHNGVVYFGAYDGNVYALDAKTGTKKWIYFDADWIGSSPAIAQDLGLLYIGLEYGLFTKKGGLAALDVKRGKEVWKHFFPELTHASPAYSKKNQIVICGSNDGIVRAFNAKNGDPLWEIGTGAPVRYSVAVSDEGGVTVFGSEDGKAYIIDIKTGAVRHTFEMMAGSYSTPLIIGKKVYITSLDKYLYCVDTETGKEIWRFHTLGRIFSSPLKVGNSIYIGSNDGWLYEINADTGENTALFLATERIVNAIAYNEKTGKIFIPTSTNEIYCLTKNT